MQITIYNLLLFAWFNHAKCFAIFLPLPPPPPSPTRRNGQFFYYCDPGSACRVIWRYVAGRNAKRPGVRQITDEECPASVQILFIYSVYTEITSVTCTSKTRYRGATLRLGRGGGTISASILGGHKTLFLTNSL